MKKLLPILVLLLVSFHPNAQNTFNSYEDNFNSLSWTPAAAAGMYGPYYIQRGDNITYQSTGGYNDTGGLRMRTTAGSHYGVSMKYRFENNNYNDPTELYAQFKVKYDSNFTEYNGKGPGFDGTYESTTQTMPTEWTGAGGWGNKPSTGKNGWSARTAPHARDHTDVVPNNYYVYHTDTPANQTWGDTWQSGAAGHMNHNTWYTVEQYVKLNDIGSSNGILKLWLDGSLIYTKTDIEFRKLDVLKVYGYWFDVYHGGGDKAEGTEYVYFDDFKLSTSYIGTGSSDTEAPSTPTSLAAANITETTVDLSWTASIDNVGVTGYDVLNGTTLLTTVTSGTSYQVTGLTASTEYTFNVKAKDAAGNISTAASITKTTATPDTTAPSAPTNLAAANITATTMDLSWTASTDNVGVTGYDVLNGTTLLTTVTSATSYQVTGLTASTEYTFNVKAKDAAGNLSTAASITKTTAPSAATTYSETFEKLTGTAGSGTWVTNESFTGDEKNWTITAKKVSGSSAINGKGIYFQSGKEGIKSQTLTDGIASFSVKCKSLWTTGNERKIELLINGVVKGSKTFTSSALQTFSVSNINIAGDVIITVKNASSTVANNTITIDDISWTSYSAATVAVTGVSVSPTSVSIVKGNTSALTETVSPTNATDKTVAWSSSNTSIATVSSSGVVTAVAAGSATITVTTTDGSKTATCDVTVTDPIAVTGVSVSPTSVSIEKGSTSTLVETVSPTTATDKTVAWTSSDTAIATVNSSGVVTAVAAGTTQITVTTTDGSKTAICAVTVTESVSYCASKGDSVVDEYIQRVQIGSIDHNVSTNNAAGHGNGYSDLTSLSTDLTNGQSATITITPKWTGTVYDEGYSVWIDYNKDGDFTDSGEQVWSKAKSQTTPVSGSFTVPTSATTGATRMRVSMEYNAIPGPCDTGSTNFAYGEVEDYTVNIQASSSRGGNTKTESVNQTPEKVVANERISKTSIFPNPFTSTITIKLADEFNQVMLIDITGRIIVKQQIKGMKVIKLSPSFKENASGIYILKLIGKETTETHKLIRK